MVINSLNCNFVSTDKPMLGGVILLKPRVFGWCLMSNTDAII